MLFVRIIAFWGPYLGPLVMGNYHLELKGVESRMKVWESRIWVLEFQPWGGSLRTSCRVLATVDNYGLTLGF